MNIQQNVFLVGHEIGHCIYEHFLRVGDRDKRYWNMAGDYKINGMLVREKIGEIIDQVKICFDPKDITDVDTTLCNWYGRELAKQCNLKILWRQKKFLASIFFDVKNLFWS